MKYKIADKELIPVDEGERVWKNERLGHLKSHVETNLGTMLGQFESWVDNFIHQIECLISSVISRVARL